MHNVLEVHSRQTQSRAVNLLKLSEIQFLCCTVLIALNKNNC